MNGEELQRLFSEKIGVRPSVNDVETLEQIIRERMERGSFTESSDYYRYLMSSPEEFQALIEEVVVLETWFFRHPESYRFVVDYYRRIWRPAHPHGLFKVLTLPCSTGEEPYSLLMAFLQAGNSLDHISVDAIDISNKALDKAREGVYYDYSFRSKELHFRSLYFEQVGEGAYKIDERLKEHVHFDYGNCVDSNLFLRSRHYDLILCRNLLIYFHAGAQKRTLELFARLLGDKGLLIVGPAEAEIVRKNGYEQHKGAGAFAYFSRAKPKVEPIAVAEEEREVQAALSTHYHDPGPLLSEVQRLADQALFAEATDLCLVCMERYGVTSQGYYLLGVIQHAMGFEKMAEDFFKKAVILDPEHHEALVYLALLAEARSDAPGAIKYRNHVRGKGEL